MKTKKTLSSGIPSSHNNRVPDEDYSRVQQALIAIACLTIFPLIYLIGRSITNWLS